MARSLNKAIFSYIDNTEKGEAITLEDLIHNKTISNIDIIKDVQNEIKKINKETINLEHKLTSKYKKAVIDNLSKCQNNLERHENNKPPKVDKPKDSFSDKEEKLIKEYDEKINELDQNIEKYKSELTEVNSNIDILINVQSDIDTLESSIKEMNKKLFQVQGQIYLDDEKQIIQYTMPKEKVSIKIKELKDRRDELRDLLDDSDELDKSLYKKRKAVKEAKKGIIDKSDTKEKAYQKYLEDVKEWELKRSKIIGSESDNESLTYYEVELKKINQLYPKCYSRLKTQRKNEMEKIYNQNVLITDIYSQVYQPIDRELANLLHHIDEEVEFSVSLVNTYNDLPYEILKYVNHSFSGVFNGRDNAHVEMERYIKETDFSNLESLHEFTDKVFTVVSEDLDKSSNVIKNKEEFYNKLFCMNYLGVEFNLNYSGKELLELSPGERGIVLLIFYLALNKGQEPLIIDQPEDNLDNESVFNQLVPCIIEAKKQRQVIIVTHNPNIAIACDAEQIIHCKIDKSKNEITYTSGSIEDEVMRQKIIDVLEGTKPAFTLRRKKYLF